MELRGTTALVTGATGGLGAAIARSLHDRGAHLPRRLTEWLLRRVPPVERFVGIPASAIDYFVHPTHYDTATAQRDLTGSGVSCPAVPDHLPRVAALMREHRDADLGVTA